jgi:ABC-type multidrug transport system ATPase subunit
VVIFSTHVVADVASLCDETAILNRGALLAQGPPRAALDALRGAVWEAEVPREHVAALASRHTAVAVYLAGTSARIRLVARGAPPNEAFALATPTLEDHYFDVLARAEAATVS